VIIASACPQAGVPGRAGHFDHQMARNVPAADLGRDLVMMETETAYPIAQPVQLGFEALMPGRN
jgi:hypothetical protein